MKHHFRLIFLATLLTQPCAAAEHNLLRGGGMEGGAPYWILRNSGATAQAGDAAQGGWFLRVPKGFVHSQPVELEPGKAYTFAAFARCESGTGSLSMTAHPTPRLAGVPPFAIGRGGGKGLGSKPVGATWTRVSWTVTLPDYRVEKHSFNSPWWWDYRNWWVFAEVKNGGGWYDLDGVTLVAGDTDPGALPDDRIEVACTALDLPGYARGANLLPAGATVTLRVGAWNPSPTAVAATLRLQQVDYTGTRVFATTEQPLNLPGDATTVVEPKVTLTATGMVLARAQVIAADGSVMGSSSQPLTTLPFPKAATRHDPAERFGATFVVGSKIDSNLLPVAQALGLSWARWCPMMNWSSIQPGGPDEWKFPPQVEAYLAKGIGQNVVLYSLPKWAKGTHHFLPKDMEWKTDDPRWADLTVVTAWDRYVSGMLKRYPGPSFVWEVVNEPQFEKLDPLLYVRFVQRTAAVIRAVDPTAKVLINSVNGFDGISKDFIRLGGVPAIDVFTFHNYNNGLFSSAEGIRSMARAFKRGPADTRAPVEIWFNEGWTWTPSARDSRVAGMLGARTSAVAADQYVRAHAETFSAGMEKMIYFNLAYEQHGRSWWDWGGDGTQIWDDDNLPTAAVPALNALIHHLGRSKALGAVRLPQGWVHIFQDERNQRGVAVMWGIQKHATLPIPLRGLALSDLMGNPLPAPNGDVQLAVAERPVYLTGATGDQLAAAYAPLAVPVMELSDDICTIPRDWVEREERGNPYLVNGQPLWEAVRLLPADPAKLAHWRRLPTFDRLSSRWADPEASQGGNPSLSFGGDGAISLGSMSPWKGGEPHKMAGLVFHTPQAGTWKLDMEAHAKRWEGRGACTLRLFLLNSEQGEVQQLATWDLEPGKETPLTVEAIQLAQGQRLGLVFSVGGMFTGAGCRLTELRLVRR